MRVLGCRKAVVVVVEVVMGGAVVMFRDGGCKQNTEKVESRAVSVLFPSFGGSSTGTTAFPKRVDFYRRVGMLLATAAAESLSGQ
jgi:hypothetical protein